MIIELTRAHTPEDCGREERCGVCGEVFRTEVVMAFTKGLVTPLIAAAGGETNFSESKFEINGSEFLYGQFIDALLAFLIIAAVVFFLVIKPVNALMDRLQPAPAVDVETRACPECISDIPISATRCAFCTSKVDPISSPPPAAAT